MKVGVGNRFLGVAVGMLAAVAAGAQPGGGAEMEAVRALGSMVESSGEAPLEEFAQRHLSERYRGSLPPEALLAHLRNLRAAARGATGLDVEKTPRGVVAVFSGGGRSAAIEVDLDLGPPWKIDRLELRRRGESGDDPDSALRRRVRAIEGLAADAAPPALEAFKREQLSPGFVASMPAAELDGLLRRIGQIVAVAGSIMVSPGESVRIAFRGAENGDVLLRLEPQAPYRIASLRLEMPVAGGAQGGREVEPIGWETLETRLEEAAARGFSGTVLVVRGAQPYLHRAYGLADRERGIANTIDTVYGIGSTPIDFTRAAILLLGQEGKLSLSDPITRFLTGVPEEKRSITLEHLMSGRSGLPNFHHDPGVDTDYDLTWIDRETALERILGRPLVFPPGTGEAHSHSAFVLLAAIVEIVSGEPYPEFVRQRLLAPAGMTRTGFYGPNPGLENESFAVGYGRASFGEVNSPPHWGPTSWLAMGSGGMVSNPADMYRWVRAIESGKILDAESLERYRLGGILMGGSDRGFLFVYTPGGEDMVFFSSNSHDGASGVRELAMALARLVRPQPAAQG